ncbi:MAG: FAD-binding protein [Cyclobacteriaceae bacterium]|nr:FAD-binding protein [Cyclobacteriaceae bacterium]
MKRKDFIKTSSLLVTGGMVAPFISCQPSSHETMTTEARKNWAGNYRYKAPNLHLPQTTEEVQALVKELDKQKALGSRHCFNNIADSPMNQISTQNLKGLVDLNSDNLTVTVESGVRYGDICSELHEQGFALHNLASLPHITTAGACATGTHGSGDQNGNLATAVNKLELVVADGSVMEVSKAQDPDLYAAAVVGLGAFGIVTKVTLDIQPTFDMRQDVYQNLPLSAFTEHFEEIMSAGYSVSLFTDWMDQKISQIWIKRRLDQEILNFGEEFFGARAATKNLHPITSLSAEPCTEQMGVPGPWWDRLPHFKMGFTPSSGEELQSEYFVPRRHAIEAILALEKKRDLIYPQLQISELRFIAADDFWMSPCYHQDSVAIHFTWKTNWPEVRKLLPMIEGELSPFNVKPHWGKLFTLKPQILQSRYERYADFKALASNYDPDGKFRNAFLDLNIYGD